MSGGSQHNPNGRQSQLGAGWSPMQVASYLARAPQAHMASERGVTWHTPTPPHLYHVPAPSPPDPLQAIKASAAGNVFRHAGTPPDLYRHTPTPPDKHLVRHTPSPGDVKSGAAHPPADIYPHLGQTRDKLVRPEDILSYARGGVDLTLARSSAAANGAPIALSVRDAPTINSLIARAQPRHPHARVDSLLERLVPSPVSPHSVIMHSRAGPTPSPPSSNEDSADSCGAPPGSKRKRKPERTVRVPSVPPPPTPPESSNIQKLQPEQGPMLEPKTEIDSRLSPSKVEDKVEAQENGDTQAHLNSNGPPLPEKCEPEVPHTRRKTRSGSAETIDDIAAMIASTDRTDSINEEPGNLTPEKPMDNDTAESDTPVTIDKLKSVLASPDPTIPEKEVLKSPPRVEEAPISETPVVEAAAAPKRRSTRTSNTESTNVPVESPSEAKPAEPETSEAKSAEPIPASIVDVEDQLEKMFAGIEEDPDSEKVNKKETPTIPSNAKGKKRRKPTVTKAEKKCSRRSSRASTGDEGAKKKPGRKKNAAKKKKGNEAVKDAYDSGSNASSGRSRGPYVQIRGRGDSPLSVSVINAATGEDEGEPGARRKHEGEFRNGLRARGLHCSTLGLRYDATTPDASWVCIFCERGPHARADAPSGTATGEPLGDLFGPYSVSTRCDEFLALPAAERARWAGAGAGVGVGEAEMWLHESCAVWAGGLVAAGARVRGLAAAAWGARAALCRHCGRPGAALSCAARLCPARTHAPCALALRWRLRADFRALCPVHAQSPER